MTMLFDCLSTIHSSITLVCLPVVSVCVVFVSVFVLSSICSSFCTCILHTIYIFTPTFAYNACAHTSIRVKDNIRDTSLHTHTNVHYTNMFSDATCVYVD